VLSQDNRYVEHDGNGGRKITKVRDTPLSSLAS
jgi:hypothetical protein